jgi:hypothetical protein
VSCEPAAGRAQVRRKPEAVNLAEAIACRKRNRVRDALAPAAPRSKIGLTGIM